MIETYKILAINPGSTSTKVAYFENIKCISSITIRHESEELVQYKSVVDQYEYRKDSVTRYLEENGIAIGSLHAIVGRGGLLKPLRGGTYYTNDNMLEDLRSLRYGEHASNLGGLIAHELASPAGIPSFIVNPVVVDEMEDIARYSGLSCIPRKSVFHALNQKAVAARAAKDLGKEYNNTNLVVAHLGGGISVAAHYRGSVIDVNNGLEEGPFSPERSGGLPVLQLIDICYSGKYSVQEVKKMAVGKGGLMSYLGTADCKTIEDRANAGDKEADMLLQAMAYQIAKEIGGCSTVMRGSVDAVVLTGGLAYSTKIVSHVEERVRFIAPVLVYPGEDEMLAMAEGVCNVLSGKEKALKY
ncbi:MAG: butyrate kinase [Clostridia bacterium]|nr:butyrate kinase [Clostridia bacterium]